MTSSAARLAYGPVWPKPDTEARTEVLDDHVGAVDEAQKGVPAAGVLEVDDDAAFAPVDAGEVCAARLAVASGEERAVAPGLIAPGLLDLHDVCAEVGEGHRAVGPGENPGEVDDA